MRLLFLFILSLSSCQPTWAVGTTTKKIDTIKTANGNSLTVPTSGATIDSDSNTLTLTNKSMSGSSNTFTNIPAGTALTGQVPVANGGTGASTLTANNVILGNGTSAVTFVAPGTSGNVLTSNGTTWASSAASSPALGVVSKTSAYNVTTSDNVILCSSATFTVTLYTAVGNTGKTVIVKKTDSASANSISIATTSAQTIDGASTITLTTQNEAVTLVSDGSNWQIQNKEFDGTWKTFTSTFGHVNGSGTPVPGTNTQNSRWRRITGGIEIVFFFRQTNNGTDGTNTIYTWTIPNSSDWTVTGDIVTNGSLVSSNLNSVLGYGVCGVAGGSGVTTSIGRAVFVSTTAFAISSPANSANSFFWSDNGAGFADMASITVTCQIQVPLTGFL